MDSTVIVAGIGAVPATLGAAAAFLAARRTTVGNRELRRIKSLLQAHMSDATIHNMPPRHLGAVRKEGKR